MAGFHTAQCGHNGCQGDNAGSTPVQSATASGTRETRGNLETTVKATITDAKKQPKYPDVVVPDIDHIYGNIYMVLTTVKRAMRRNGVPEQEIKRYRAEAMAGYGPNVLSGNHDLFAGITRQWVTCRCESGRRCD